jgi:hypothetical protein
VRIEYQGMVVARPTYNHVGYTSAAFVNQWGQMRPPSQALAVSIVLVTLVASMMIARRRSRLGQGAAIAVLVLGLGCAALSYAAHRQRPFVWPADVPTAAEPLTRGPYDLAPACYVTLYRLERLCAQTEEWQKQHGRLPTVAEWQAMHTGAEACDGLGTPFRYQVFAKPSDEDGQLYRIDNLVPEHGRLTGDHTVPPTLSDHELGPDGLFGTSDDQMGQEGLKLDPEAWEHYPHARAARTPVPGSKS